MQYSNYLVAWEKCSNFAKVQKKGRILLSVPYTMRMTCHLFFLQPVMCVQRQ